MQIEVRRLWETDKSICGIIWIDGQEESWTLEPARTNPVNPGHPCVVAGGPYNVILTPSPHLGYITPEVEGVPGRSDIRIHIGNFPKDTLGCVLVGTDYDAEHPDLIRNSKVAFDKLMTLLRTADSGISISFFDPPASIVK